MAIDWTDEALLERNKKGWYGGLDDGTPCGSGSTLENTVNVRREMPRIIAKYNLRSMCDAGAGDMHWVRDVFTNSQLEEYRPFDLVPRANWVVQRDISKQALPVCDVILCRAVLIHMNPVRVLSTIELFRKSARYLFASQYENIRPFNARSQFNRTDLRPLLGEPLESIAENQEEGFSLGFWPL